LLSRGADPARDIADLAHRERVEFHLFSMGQGQENQALSMLKKCTFEGTWLMLQNCHLNVDFMGELDRLLRASTKARGVGEVPTIDSTKGKGNKKETAETGITVTYPSANQIQGNWTLTKVETREQLNVDQTVSIFNLPIDSSRTFAEKYEVTEDSIFVTHGSEQFYLFQFRNGYKYENGALKINQNSFPVVRFSSTEMILQGPYFKGFELLYLER